MRGCSPAACSLRLTSEEPAGPDISTPRQISLNKGFLVSAGFPILESRRLSSGSPMHAEPLVLDPEQQPS